MNKRPNMTMSGVLLGTVVAIAAVGIATAPAAAKVNSPQNADSVAAFWDSFRDAVIKGDKGTVAALTRFPIARGYGMRSLKNKAQLKRRFRELFFAETDAAKCFPKATPYVEKTRPREFSISCPFARDGGEEEPFVYTFIRSRTGWRFTSFENINE